MGTGIKDILMGIQRMLGEPNIKSPANKAAYELYIGNRQEYDHRVRIQALEINQSEEPMSN